MIIREMNPSEYDLLKDFTYEAIFIPEGVTPPDRSIVELPELAIYYKDFGSKPGDLAFAAEDDGQIIGAVWMRIMNDYGHVDDDMPSLALSVLEEYRGKGIGSLLLHDMVESAKEKGYQKLSLAVQKANYAVRMYERAGFETIRDSDEEYIMVRE